MTPPLIWSEPIAIHSYDVDFSRQAGVEALCLYFLEAAWNHAEVLGFGFSHLARDHKLWVLSRLLLEFEAYPRWGEKLMLNTWPRGAQSIFALRDFELLDATGKRMAGGSSAWLILDVASRRPQRVEKFLTAITPVTKQATGRDPAKLPAPRAAFSPQQAAKSQTTPTLLQTEVCAVVPPWMVRYSDVDLNGHVNSARYLGWLMDSYPPEWHQRLAPRQLEVNYLAESHQGDTLWLETQQIGPQEFLHAIFKADQQETCRARIQWGDRG